MKKSWIIISLLALLIFSACSTPHTAESTPTTGTPSASQATEPTKQQATNPFIPAPPAYCSHNFVSDICTVCGVHTGLNYELCEDGYYVSSWYGDMDSQVVIPAFHEGRPVIGIGQGAFYECEQITSVVIPNTVTQISAKAFYNCKNLQNIFFDESSQLTTIDSEAFWGCSALTSLSIPSSLKAVGHCALYCSNPLLDVYITNLEAWINIDFESPGMLEYGGLYLNNILLTDLVIPESVTVLKSHTFSGCKSLKSVTIHKDITQIGYCTFASCPQLKNVYISDLNAWCKIDFVDYFSNPMCNGADLYLNNQRVTNLIFPGEATSVGTAVFAGCNSLVSITIPESVTSIGSYAFWDCASLTDINLPDTVTYIGEFAFANCHSMTEFQIPHNVSVISRGTFWCCDKLSAIVIPDAVARIESNAFTTCIAMKEVVLGNGLSYIANNAFNGSRKCKTVFFNGTVREWGCVTLDHNWNFNAPFTEIICNDGIESL